MPSAPRSEHGLEVLWQRHLPAGLKTPAAERALIRLAKEMRAELFDRADMLDDADLVVTISRRPLP